LETEQNECKFESYALVVTHKVGTLGNIPATDGLIKGIGFSEHIILTRENNGKHDWLRALVPSKATHALVLTYKLGTNGDVPVFKGLVKG
jgi:hypothetical protein